MVVRPLQTGNWRGGTNTYWGLLCPRHGLPALLMLLTEPCKVDITSSLQTSRGRLREARSLTRISDLRPPGNPNPLFFSWHSAPPLSSLCVSQSPRAFCPVAELLAFKLLTADRAKPLQNEILAVLSIEKSSILVRENKDVFIASPSIPNIWMCFSQLQDLRLANRGTAGKSWECAF